MGHNIAAVLALLIGLRLFASVFGVRNPSGLLAGCALVVAGVHFVPGLVSEVAFDVVRLLIPLFVLTLFLRPLFRR